MYDYSSIRNFLPEFISGIRFSYQAPIFIRDHKLWKGFTKHRIVMIAMIILGLAIGYKLFGVIRNWWFAVDIDGPWDIGISAASLVGDVFNESYRFLAVGSFKYFILIVMELLIFHVAIRTNEIITGRSEKLTGQLFLNAQIRMIKVVIYSYIMELIVSILISIALSILSASLIKTPLLFLVQCFFLGFALIDNYNEIRGVGIRDSFRYTRNFVGASTAIGLVLYITMLVPIVGPVVGTMVGAVATTLCMHYLQEKLPYAENVKHIDYV